MANPLRVQKGGVQALYFDFREVRRDSLDGQRIDPHGVTVTILNPDGTTQTNAASADYVETGVFLYYWDTAGLASGEYLAKVRFGQAFSSASGGATKVGEVSVPLRLVASL